MKTLHPDVAAAILDPKALVIRQLFYFIGRNRSTGEDEAIGFWNGEDTVSISVYSGASGGAETRTYYGSGALLSASEIVLTADLTVQTMTIDVSPFTPEIEIAIRGYDARLARIDVHRLLLDPGTMNAIGVPDPHFYGRIDKIDYDYPAVGGSAKATIRCASHIRELSRINPMKKSFETQKLRSGDLFRRDSATAITWDIPWGRNPKK